MDRLGTLDDAIDEAKELAGIKDDEEVERVLLPEPRGLFDDLFGMQGLPATPTAEALVLAGLAKAPGMDAITASTQALLQLASGRPLMMLPARVNIR